ncbi:class I SAM-dependent methyltransferase [Rufibacter psychrotolerans]|uniref:class I SAM-dependent methyltransferase n=1 Tax=Rufibacter psychrotolerans TaxID=2812556 RepID=UPI001967410A|nr:class I SAM-dependent methyltransferase [Rufibacter sp. SYSU D00308]
MKRNTFLPPYLVLLLLWGTLLLFAGACDSQPVKSQQATTSVYATKTPHPDGTGKVYLGREIAHVMSAAGGEWLERDTRQEEENVNLAIQKLNLQPNSVVADVGAGTGYYTFRLAPLVPHGKVYAVEVQDAFVSALEARKKELGLSNVTVVKGSAQSPNLPENSLDLAIMVDVYHELAYPREMLQALHRALKPTGQLLLLEYRAEDPNVPIKELHKMSVAQANKELAANGFTLVKREDFLPMQHFLLYGKRQE